MLTISYFLTKLIKFYRIFKIDKNCLNWQKLSKLSNIFKNSQNCQKLSKLSKFDKIVNNFFCQNVKLVKISKKMSKLTKIVKIDKNCQNWQILSKLSKIVKNSQNFHKLSGCVSSKSLHHSDQMFQGSLFEGVFMSNVKPPCMYVCL